MDYGNDLPEREIEDEENIEMALERLNNLKNADNPSGTGLCNTALSNLSSPTQEKLFRSWEHFSGNSAFPVPASEILGVSGAVKTYYNNSGMYNKNTEYGRMRYKLMDHCIEYLTNIINQK